MRTAIVLYPALNAWAAIFKNADFSQSSLKVTKLSNFSFLLT